MFISDALAQETNAVEYVSSNSVSGTLIQLGLIFLIFYFLLIRPQQKKIKEHENMLIAIKKGDQIITGGGIYGTVVNAVGEVLTVKIADNIEIKVARSMVRDVLSDEAVKETFSETKKTLKKKSKK